MTPGSFDPRDEARHAIVRFGVEEFMENMYEVLSSKDALRAMTCDSDDFLVAVPAGSVPTQVSSHQPRTQE